MDYGHLQAEAKLKDLEKKIQTEYKKAAKEVEASMNKYLEHFEANDNKMKIKRLLGDISEKDYKDWRMKQMVITEKWEKMRDDLTAVYMNADKAAMQMITDHKIDVYALNHNYGIYEVEKQTHINTMMGLYSKETVARLMKDNPRLLPLPGKKTSQKIREGKLKKWNDKQIQSVMTQGILQGESIPKISKRLATTVSEKNAYDHYRAARTMTTAAENAGRLDSYFEAETMGIQMSKMWIAAHDARTRMSHRQLDGETVPLKEPFSNDLMYPADPFGDPAEVYNCRCTMTGTVSGVDGIDLSDLTDVGDWEDLWDVDYEAWESGRKVEPSAETIEKQNTIANAREFDMDYHGERNFEDNGWWDMEGYEQDAVKLYTDEYYWDMNMTLRGVDGYDALSFLESSEGDVLDITIRDAINDCTSALAKCSLADDTILYRGMGTEMNLADSLGLGKFDLRDLADDGSLIGQTFTEKAFGSTGINLDAGWPKQVNLEIVAPKGTQALYVDPISANSGEYEVLLQQGTVFEIIGSRREGSNYFLKVLIVDQRPVML